MQLAFFWFRGKLDESYKRVISGLTNLIQGMEEEYFQNEISGILKTIPEKFKTICPNDYYVQK